jgi:simple sugar transport system ATP-binding protein
MVHQHFMLIPVMTVTENIVLAQEPSTRRPARLRRAAKRVRELSRAFGSPSTRRAHPDITVGQQQRVEILKALYRGARSSSSTSRPPC